MPQMSPLMWMELFTTFSILLMISMVKIYFTPSNNTLPLEELSAVENNNFKIKWMW